MRSAYHLLGLNNLGAASFRRPLKEAYIQSRPIRYKPARTCFSSTAIAMTRPIAKVAICQICSTEDVEHNLSISKNVIRDAVKAGAKVGVIVDW